jgi:hypothetical protein
MAVRRKRYRVLVLASLVAALVVPVGFALSLEGGPGRRSSPLPETFAVPAGIAAVVVVTPRSVVTDATRSFSFPVPDAAKLFIIGSVLIGLAAAVRKAG